MTRTPATTAAPTMLRFTGESNGHMIFDEHVVLLREYAPHEEFAPGACWTCAAVHVGDGESEWIVPVSQFVPLHPDESKGCRCDGCELGRDMAKAYARFKALEN